MPPDDDGYDYLRYRPFVVLRWHGDWSILIGRIESKSNTKPLDLVESLYRFRSQWIIIFSCIQSDQGRTTKCVQSALWAVAHAEEKA